MITIAQGTTPTIKAKIDKALTSKSVADITMTIADYEGYMVTKHSKLDKLTIDTSDTDYDTVAATLTTRETAAMRGAAECRIGIFYADGKKVTSEPEFVRVEEGDQLG